MEWKNVYKGMLMGITELIPGVSAGTIAVMLGIYDRLVMAISGFFSREWEAASCFFSADRDWHGRSSDPVQPSDYIFAQ